MLRVLSENTLILYLRAGPEMEDELIRRAVAHPKPLYYREDFLDERLREYLQLEGHASPDDICPDRFVRWIFPALVRHRRPRYERIATHYGYTTDATDIAGLRDEKDFLELVAIAIERKQARH
jgi:siderophore synthetase component